MNLELKSTNDGSYTLYNASLDETYHSIHGARQEAMHVFIKNGLLSLNTKELSIIEVGLGTGMNAMLTCVNAGFRNIKYVGLEPFPIQQNLLEQYIQLNVLNENENLIWNRIMGSDNSVELEQFSFEKKETSILDFETIKKFDLIYFDAFAPNKQNEMWDTLVFQKLYGLLKSGGKLITYCAQGQFKRNLKTAGFEVTALPGPPGKREMTLGVKT